MIDPGPGAKRSKLRSRRRPEPSGGRAGRHLDRTSDNKRDDRILTSVREFDGNDNPHRESFPAVPDRFGGDGGDETRRAGRAKHSRHLAPIVAWAVASIALGLVLGLAAVILPLSAPLGSSRLAGVVLLWVMPDLPLVSPGLIRKAFFGMLIADLSIPYYYMIQFPACLGFRLVVSPPSRSSRHSLSRSRRRLMSEANCGARPRVIADCHLCGRISRHGHAIDPHVYSTNRIRLGAGRGAPIVVHAVLGNDLYS